MLLIITVNSNYIKTNILIINYIFLDLESFYLISLLRLFYKTLQDISLQRNAVCNKLLKQLFAMAKSGVNYDTNYRNVLVKS